MGLFVYGIAGGLGFAGAGQGVGGGEEEGLMVEVEMVDEAVMMEGIT